MDLLCACGPTKIRPKPNCESTAPLLSLQSPLRFCNPYLYLRPRLRTIHSLAVNSMDTGGSDSDGRRFTNAEEMWKEHAGDKHKKTKWYSEAVAYWEGVDASVDGVLGGYKQLNDPDIRGSEAFLKSLLAERFVDGGKNRHLVALDCGSGIGRITKNLLIRCFNENHHGKECVNAYYRSHILAHASSAEVVFYLWPDKSTFEIFNSHSPSFQVDLLEPVAHFLDVARESLSSENHTASDMHKVTNFFCVPLQEFTPDAGRYDVIWVQWCIGHLTDSDFVYFFKRAKIGLKPGGFFFLKENTARSGFILDKEDRSVTRSDLYFKELFTRCGLHLYKCRDQRGLPEELFAVRMYALTTDTEKKAHKSRSKAQVYKPGIIK